MLPGTKFALVPEMTGAEAEATLMAGGAEGTLGMAVGAMVGAVGTVITLEVTAGGGVIEGGETTVVVGA